MIKKIWIEITKKENLRENLSDLRQKIKTASDRKELKALWNDQEDLLRALFSNEDPKVRRNLAKLLGDCPDDQYRHLLFIYYKAETQQYVKASYLEALHGYDCKDSMDFLQECYENLSLEKAAAESKKHVEAQLRALSVLYKDVKGQGKHTYHGKGTKQEVLMIMEPSAVSYTRDLLEKIDSVLQIKEQKAGILLQTEDVMPILHIRTYRELLFKIPGISMFEEEADQAAEAITEPLIHYLQQTHRGEGAYAFRLEIRNDMSKEKKAGFSKRLCVALEEKSKRALINSVSDYELELRLIKGKNGKYLTLLKDNTIKDDRFSYRKEWLADSIKPVNAALLCAIASEYLTEDKRVLDPFCGVGSVLIERNRLCKAKALYGIDVKKDAVLKARNNSEKEGTNFYYTNKNCLDFTHTVPFDEIITELPTRNAILCERAGDPFVHFIKSAHPLLKADGQMIVYAEDCIEFGKKAIQYGFELLKESKVVGKDSKTLYILKKA